MSLPTQYLMPEKIIIMIEKAKLSLSGLRLMHSCYAYVDQHPGLRVDFVALTGKPSCTARTIDIASICGPANPKSNAWVRTAAAELHGGKLMSKAVLSEDGRRLSFKFRPDLGPASWRSDKTKFAMLDAIEVSQISSAYELLVYTRAVMVGGADHHKFALPKIGRNGSPWTEATKKKALRALARVSERLQCDFVVIPVTDAMTGAVVSVEVKPVTPASRWSSRCLYPRRCNASVAVVHPGEFRSLTNADLKERHVWTRAVGP